MQCPRCQRENRPDATFCDRCGAPFQRPSGSALPEPTYGQVQRFLTEALARESATSEILRVISNSPSDVQPVFNAIVHSAVRLCNGGASHRPRTTQRFGARRSRTADDPHS
jgi:zinc-ribbon domain